MKGIKRLSYVLIFIISLFVINNKINALTLEEVNEEFIYNNIVPKLEENYSDFKFINYPYVFCQYRINESNVYCHFFTEENVNNITIVDNYDYNFNFKLSTSTNIYEAHNSNNIIYTSKKRFTNNNYYLYENNIYFSNFLTDEITNVKVLNFNPYLYPEEEKEELEITNKATTLLNFMIDKTKNIYEVLINNEIFLLCIGILISYLIFMFLLKLRK